MIVKNTPLAGVYLITPERISDERGFFARTFCTRELEAAGISFTIRQTSTSFNPHPLTLRGMHYQATPSLEAKIIRCTRGKIFDVVLDLRESSPTFHKWHAAELSAHNGFAMLIPAGCAHGFLTLSPESEVFYMMDAFHQPDAARGVRWNDPVFGIAWPAKPALISENDMKWPLAKP